MNPAISVITICYNNLGELLQTCASVDQQSLPPYEHWIIDGSTSPEIKEYLENNPQPSYRKWLCEKDDGISDAFNKGIIKASGNILNMLNSADYYINEHVLKTVSATFQDHPDLEWVHSKYKLRRGGIWVVIGKKFEPAKLYRGMRSIAHQSMFVKKELHNKYGLYDKGLKIAMDYDFVCRIVNESFLFIDVPLIVFAPDGTSSRNYLASLKENKEVYLRYNRNSLKLAAWQIRLKMAISLWLYISSLLFTCTITGCTGCIFYPGSIYSKRSSGNWLFLS